MAQSTPPHELLKTFFVETVDHLMGQINSKVNDNNNWKATSLSGHKRELVIPSTHRLSFTCCLGARCFPNELSLRKEDKYTEFSLRTVIRVEEVLKNTPLSRFHKNGDLTLVAPWGVLLDDTQCSFIDGDEENGSANQLEQQQRTVIFEKHAIVISLRETEDNFTAFVPCGGPNPETDEIPNWVTSVSLEELCHVNLEKVPVIKGIGLSSIIKKGDNYFLAVRDQFEEGDVISFKGEKVKVRTISVDFMSDLRNCVGIEGKFNKDHSRQSFKIIRIPRLQGRIAEIPKKQINIHRPVQLTFESSKTNIGSTTVSYFNFCFNSVGFLTHDTAVTIDDFN